MAVDQGPPLRVARPTPNSLRIASQVDDGLALLPVADPPANIRPAPGSIRHGAALRLWTYRRWAVIIPLRVSTTH